MMFFKNMCLGLAISFIASIPFGYLNLIGLEIFNKNEYEAMILFLLGVILIEFIVIYITLYFAAKLLSNQKLLYLLEILSVLFMFLMAFYFFRNLSEKVSVTYPLDDFREHSPFILGLLLSLLNFIQIPFWMGWNVYLLKEKNIKFDNRGNVAYALGAVIGTFLGMLCFILFFNYIIESKNSFLLQVIKYLIPLVFLFLGFKQMLSLYKKVVYK